MIFTAGAFQETYYTLSATRSFALLARGLKFSSSSSGSIGFLYTLLSVCLKPQTHIGASLGQVQPFSLAAMPVFNYSVLK